MSTPKNNSVRKAFDILSTISNGQREMTATQVAAATDMTVATAYRFLITLEEVGALVRSDSNRFQLGMLLLDLGQRVEQHKVIIESAQPHLRALADRLREAVKLSVLESDQAVTIAKRDAGRSLQISMPLRVPAHCSAAGKVLIAGLPAIERDKMLAAIKLVPMTARTHTDRDALRAELTRVDEQGYAIDDGELEEGLSCLAVPVRDSAGKVVAALSVSAPSSRLDWRNLEKSRDALVEHAGAISRALFVESRVLPHKAKPRGMFPHIKRVGDFLFVSGTSARRPDNTFEGARMDGTGHVNLDIRVQTRATIGNIRDILESVGARLDDLVEVTAYLTSMKDYAGFNETYADFFGFDGPTRSAVAVNELPHPHQILMLRALAYHPRARPAQS
jgi:DNA-binding IclR family transcriptional regulator/enamine deaminase RidA (YjgF/YER057c/UK114 family)